MEGHSLARGWWDARATLLCRVDKKGEVYVENSVIKVQDIVTLFQQKFYNNYRLPKNPISY